MAATALACPIVLEEVISIVTTEGEGSKAARRTAIKRLKRLSLVCRDWRGLVQSKLFSIVVLELDPVTALTITKRVPSLFQLARKVDVHPVRGRASLKTIPDIVKLASRFSRLESLTFTVSLGIQDDRPGCSYDECDLSSLRQLHIDFKLPALTSVVTRILSLAPQLQNFTLEATALVHDPTCATAPVSLPQLHRLVLPIMRPMGILLANEQFPSSYGASQLGHILTEETIGHLRTLETDSLDVIMDRNARLARLLSLNVEHLVILGGFAKMPWSRLSSFSKLKTLVSYESIGAPFFPTLLSNLPSSLETFQTRMAFLSGADEVYDNEMRDLALPSSFFDRLTKLKSVKIVYQGDPVQAHRALGIFATAFREKGIEFRAHDPTGGWIRMQAVPLAGPLPG